MIDGADLALVEACVFRVLEITDIEDVGGGEFVGGWADGGADFVELVVEDQVFLVLKIEDNTLVDVLGTFVGDTGDDRGLVADLLVTCYVEDGDSVLIVAVADVATLISLIRSR